MGQGQGQAGFKAGFQGLGAYAPPSYPARPYSLHSLPSWHPSSVHRRPPDQICAHLCQETMLRCQSIPGATPASIAHHMPDKSTIENGVVGLAPTPSLTPMYSNKTINKNKVRSEGIAMAQGISFPMYSCRTCLALGYRTRSCDAAHVRDWPCSLCPCETIHCKLYVQSQRAHFLHGMLNDKP